LTGFLPEHPVVACVGPHGDAMGMAHEKSVATQAASGIWNSMKCCRASLDHVRQCSSQKRAVAGSSSSQPSVVQCDPQGNPPSVDDMLSADPYANRFLYTGREFLKEANLYDYRNRVYSAEWGDSSNPTPSASTRGI
jgi:hypothetical protein